MKEKIEVIGNNAILVEEKNFEQIMRKIFDEKVNS